MFGFGGALKGHHRSAEHVHESLPDNEAGNDLEILTGKFDPGEAGVEGNLYCVKRPRQGHHSRNQSSQRRLTYRRGQVPAKQFSASLAMKL